MKKIIAILLVALTLFSASCSFRISPKLFYDLWKTETPESTVPFETTKAPETTSAPETTAPPEAEPVAPIFKDYQIASNPPTKLNLAQMNDRLAEDMKILRSLLTDAEKDIYDRIEKSLRLYTDVKIPIPSEMEDTYEKIYWAVQLDSPELMMSVYKIGLTNNPGTVESWAVRHTPTIDKKDVKTYTRELIYKADSIIAEMPEGLSTREKYVWIADYICNNVDLFSKDPSGDTKSDKFAGGALMRGYTSSNGFRQAYVLLCQRAGLWCTIASYKDTLYDGVVVVKFDDGETYYMYVYEAEEISPYFRESYYFKTEKDVRLKAKLSDRTLAATGTDPYGSDEPKTPETTDVSTPSDNVFEAYMSLDGLSDDAKTFFRAAKEKSGYSIVDGTLIVENGSIEKIGSHNYFRAVYGEGTAEYMKYVDTACDIGYWFINSTVLSPNPQGKIKNLYGTHTYAPIEGDYFEGNDVHDLASLRAYFETKFTDRMVDVIMKECGDGTGEINDRSPFPIVYYDGKLYAWVGGQGLFGDSFDAEFSIKENTEDRVSIICRKRAGLSSTDRFDDYEFIFVREGEGWLCDQLPDIWMGYKDRWLGQ